MQHIMCPHVISNSCDIVQQEVLGSGDNGETFYHGILVQYVLSSRNQPGQRIRRLNEYLFNIKKKSLVSSA